MKSGFAAVVPGTLPKTATLPFDQLQQDKCSKIAFQPCLDLDTDLNCDLDVNDTTPISLTAMYLYNKVGLTKHKLRDDIRVNYDAVDLVHMLSPSFPEKTPQCGPKGHLKDLVSFWHRIDANRWVISIIRGGYALPFVELPLEKEMASHKSPYDQKDFVTQQIEELLVGLHDKSRLSRHLCC